MRRPNNPRRFDFTFSPPPITFSCPFPFPNPPRPPPSFFLHRDVLGKGLVTSEGKRWADHLKVIGPAFHRPSIPRLHPVFASASARFIATLEAAARGEARDSMRAVGDGPHGRPAVEVELSAAFRQVTLEVISAVALGMDPERAGVFPHIFESVLDELNRRVYEPYRVLFPSQLAHARKLRTLNDIVNGLIRERRAERAAQKKTKSKGGKEGGAAESDAVGAAAAASYSTGAGALDAIGEGKGDMLDMILENSERLGVAFTDQDLADELKTQLLAGHETSSLMMTWTLYLLAKHPECMRKAVEQVDRELGGVVDGKPPPDNAAYQSLTYLDLAMKEALRLYSPVPILARETAEWDRLGDGGGGAEGSSAGVESGGVKGERGVLIPPRTAILINIWHLHRTPKLWGPDALEFRPERFEKDPRPFSYLPFSAGVRVCVGQHLATNEAKVVLGSVLRNFTVRLAPGQGEAVPDKYIIPVRPAGGVRVVMERRR